MPAEFANSSTPRRVAVVGSGVAGLAAAWLASRVCPVTLFEAAERPGGHARTVVTPEGVAVDTGFIVYNTDAYPNLVAWFDHLGVPTQASDMSFAVSRDAGAFEYGGQGARPLFANPGNLLRPRFWSMIADLARFYRMAPERRRTGAAAGLTLGEFLAAEGFGKPFIEDHLYPMAAAIWSTPTTGIGDYPAESLIRFFENHRLLQFLDRPVWRTVSGGSRTYVERVLGDLRGQIRLNAPVRRIERGAAGVTLYTEGETPRTYDAVILACHADQALAMLAEPRTAESDVLGAFGYTANRAVLHSDTRLAPRRKAIWSAWNYMSVRDAEGGRSLCVTYWMDLLQNLEGSRPHFLTLNPVIEPDPALVLDEVAFTHPRFDLAALNAKASLWSLQGAGGVYFAGAYFGDGFHEDGLQSGLAAAELATGARRPWIRPGMNERLRAAGYPLG